MFDFMILILILVICSLVCETATSLINLALDLRNRKKLENSKKEENDL